jgi:hypothetical protein
MFRKAMTRIGSESAPLSSDSAIARARGVLVELVERPGEEPPA